jgi:TrmH family RNA methyltransferase
VISNPSNPTVREVRRLRKRGERERRRAVLAEGARAVATALASGRPVRQVLHTRAAALRRRALLEGARRAGAALLEVTPEIMASLTSVTTAPDVLGVVEAGPVAVDEAAGRLGLGAVLAGVRDPATAGILLASLAAAGGTATVATTGTTDLFAPKAVRAAAGAQFVLAVAVGAAPEECAGALGRAGARVVAVDARGAPPADADLAWPLAVVVGDGELPAPLEAAVGQRVGPGGPPGPVPAPVVALAAVVLFEAARRRAGLATGGAALATDGPAGEAGPEEA